jgi:chemotaxis protein MotB
MARRRDDEHATAHADERWLITYADMITLLLAVFITLYALSDTNMRKFVAFAQSLSAAFNTDVFQGSQAFTVTTGQETAPDVGSLDAGQGIVASDYRAISALVSDVAIAGGLVGQVEVARVPEGISIRVSSSLLFPSGRAQLAPRALDLVDRIAQVLAPLPNPLRIEGHTDDQPPVGSEFRDNWELSAARAVAVLERLVADGLTPSRLSAAGYGQYRPLVPNTDAVARARNRRVDILILYPPAGQPAPSAGIASPSAVPSGPATPATGGPGISPGAVPSLVPIGSPVTPLAGGRP